MSKTLAAEVAADKNKVEFYFLHLVLEAVTGLINILRHEQWICWKIQNSQQNSLKVFYESLSCNIFGISWIKAKQFSKKTESKKFFNRAYSPNLSYQCGTQFASSRENSWSQEIRKQIPYSLFAFFGNIIQATQSASLCKIINLKYVMLIN